MGCTSSKDVLLKIEPEYATWESQFNGVKLSPDEILKFRDLMQKIKKHGNIPDAEELPFGDPNGNIDDLREFTFGIWNICTFDEYSLGLFLFCLYRGLSESLSSKELISIVKECFGSSYKQDEDAQRITLEIQEKSPSLDSKMFCEFLRSQKEVFEKFTSLQTFVQEKAFGLAYWKKAKAARASISHERVNEIFNQINPRVYWIGVSLQAAQAHFKAPPPDSTQRTINGMKKVSKDTTSRKEMSSRRVFNNPRIVADAPLGGENPAQNSLDAVLLNRPLSPQTGSSQIGRVDSGLSSRVGALAPLAEATGTSSPMRTSSISKPEGEPTRHGSFGDTLSPLPLHLSSSPMVHRGSVLTGPKLHKEMSVVLEEREVE